MIMDWQSLNDKLYFVDGSLRDIYVQNISRNVWQKWINFVNKNYKVEFSYFDEEKITCHSDQIDAIKVFNYWDGLSDLVLSACVKVGNVNVKCYFFDENEIENDIAPNEVNEIENHNDIINYLKNISGVLKKEVIMTIENYSPDFNEILMTVYNDEITII